MSNVLFISKQGDNIDLAIRMMRQGNDVSFWIKEPEARDCGRGMVNLVPNYQGHVKWADLIINDYSKLSLEPKKEGKGFNELLIPDKLRKMGKPVYGNDRWADMCELDRKFGAKVFDEAGIEMPEDMPFKKAEDGVKQIESDPGKYVFKPNDNTELGTYVGEVEDGQDVIDIILDAKEKHADKLAQGFELQKRIDGVEVAVGAYFDGERFMPGTTNVNYEFKKRSAGSLGKMTGEMCSVACFREGDEISKTLYKMEKILKREKQHVTVDINFIATEDKLYALEFTMRQGYPMTYLHVEALGDNDLYDFYFAVATGKEWKGKMKEGYIIGIQMVAPTFPFEGDTYKNKYYGMPIYGLTDENIDRVHFEEVMVKGDKVLTAGQLGVPLCVTDQGDSINEAREKVFKTVEQIYFNERDYRVDAGERVIEDEQQLISWGLLNA